MDIYQLNVCLIGTNIKRATRNFLGREIFWKRWTWINAPCTNTKEGPHRKKKLIFFSSIYLENSILNENLTYRCTQTEHFFFQDCTLFCEIRALFSYFLKRAVENPSLSARSAREDISNSIWFFYLIVM